MQAYNFSDPNFNWDLFFKSLGGRYKGENSPSFKDILKALSNLSPIVYAYLLAEKQHRLNREQILYCMIFTFVYEQKMLKEKYLELFEVIPPADISVKKEQPKNFKEES